ncbi:MAG: DNA polymerase III subunit delta [Pyrinomonadaceae bacterium]|nr:DNA polymerase III subunit delta [Pyrinomonadaceae bacterium]MCX7640541.1 DNA polymerase III subunit delta [Pyrinomonadaceae bacterium]MDW8303878.1 DNA polymerase III subunit delta [Acidobacteriota bacterium]
MIISKNELRAQVRKGDIKPVYLLFGEETFLRDLAAETILERASKDESFIYFDKGKFDLTENKIQDALDFAKTLPFGRKKLVKITGVKISSSVLKDSLKESDEFILRSYLEKPSETSVVVFVADEFDKRRKLAKLFIEMATVTEFNYLQGAELISWIKKKFSSLKVEVEPEAIELIINRMGSSLREINLECEKLATALYDETQKVVTRKLVDQLVADRLTPDSFTLADYLLEQNRPKAIETLKKLLNEGVETTMLLGLIASSFRRLLLAKEMMKKGIDRSEILRAVKIPFSRQEEFFRAARRSDLEWLRKKLIRISETDLAMKSSVATPQLQLEMLVIELTEK